MRAASRAQRGARARIVSGSDRSAHMDSEAVRFLVVFRAPFHFCTSYSRFAHALLTSAAASAQAVYGSIGGIVTRFQRRRSCPAPPSPSPASSATPPTRSSPTNPACIVKERLLPGAYEVQAELAGFKTAVVPAHTGQRRHADAGQLHPRQSGSSPRRSPSPAVRRCSRPTAPTSRRASTQGRSPICPCSIATSPSSSC